MGASRLRNTLTGLQTQLEAVQAELAQVLGNPDPFSAHVRESRLSYRHTSENDGKTGKRTDLMIKRSYWEAQRLGFTGTPRGSQNTLKMSQKKIQLNRNEPNERKQSARRRRSAGWMKLQGCDGLH
jgi:hypothetical protein